MLGHRQQPHPRCGPQRPRLAGRGEGRRRRAGQPRSRLLAGTPVLAPSNAAYAAARTLSDGQANPLGALGELDTLAAWVASCQGTCPPRQLDDVRVVVFAGDHGVSADGVSAYPAAITPAMVYGIAGGHAGVSALAAANDVTVRIYDLGVAVDFPDLPAEISRFKVRQSSGAIHLTDALSRAEVEQALAAGDRW
ncbi:MAG: nicotinate-nucleotide--dimethylbenzimidazole phosphoribosyltransferase [Actinobacteria bacterium]|nr:nicotinate-nucleotide--dimethylbenzimidazole phosphoribosyltransferase [Actinomycetota bacterium]